MSTKIVIRALAVLLVVGLAMIAIVILRPSRQQSGSAPVALTAPTLGQFIARDAPLPAPALTITTRSGEAKALTDFRGQAVLVNLWATWCVPCVEEMPSLDRLQARLGDKLKILAISEDRRGAEVVDPFLQRLGIKNLAIYLDPKSTALNEFAVQGLPTSFLIDRNGMILGQLEGAAKWDEEPMLSLLGHYIDAK